MIHGLLHAGLVKVKPRQRRPRRAAKLFEGLLDDFGGFFSFKNEGKNLVNQVGDDIPVLILLGLGLPFAF